MNKCHVVCYLEALNAGDGVKGEVQAREASEAGHPLHAAQLIEADHKCLKPYCTLQPLHATRQHVKFYLDQLVTWSKAERLMLNVHLQGNEYEAALGASISHMRCRNGEHTG